MRINLKINSCLDCPFLVIRTNIQPTHPCATITTDHECGLSGKKTVDGHTLAIYPVTSVPNGECPFIRGESVKIGVKNDD